ncbi:hypothetical protein GCM10010442_02380 [Kitasatospora kifunensis]|uniref:HAD superfamily hydrolase (TIGR01509 family) n=1 Tax=Kitasatospora kifunensis TaxID=58351 RepID=A0A7W7R3G9_KITKI|nr:HAD superfamily hydrolase (TIGR01509 family) [Kitasatospora kifunensis]
MTENDHRTDELPLELVIFDCDGVLVDSERIAVRVQVALGAELGWPLSESEVIERFIGRSTASIGEQVAERLGARTAAEWQRRFEESHRVAVDEGLTVVDGIEEALAELRLPSCVASSGSPRKMRHTLGRTGLYDYFDGRIFSATEVSRGKPAPDLFEHAAARMGVRPQACVVVEDSCAGVRAARAAGMRVLGYAGGLTSAERLAAAGARVFHDMRELPALLAAWEWADGAGAAGTAGYTVAARALAAQYEEVGFEQVHGRLLHLLPPAPARVLDLGAGTGRDAAALARLGHVVTAVEPTAALRAHGERLHAGSGVRWVDDALPELPELGAAGERYDLIMITAVWMHLAPRERAVAMRTVAGLLAPGGGLLMTVRQGPVPAGRRMFTVPTAEIVAQAGALGLHPVHQDERADLHGRDGVRWAELGFVRRP